MNMLALLSLLHEAVAPDTLFSASTTGLTYLERSSKEVFLNPISL